MSENVVRTDNSNILFDDEKITLGNGQDLTLSHDGTDSHITNKKGTLNIATATSAVPVSIGHTTSETTVNDNLTVTGDSTLTGGLHLTVQTVTVPQADAAATASRILTTATVIRLNATNNADDRAYLPSPTDVSTGKVYILLTDGTGCELSSEGDGTTVTTINGIDVTDAAGDFAKELALAASGTFIAIKTGANAWTVTGGNPN